MPHSGGKLEWMTRKYFQCPAQLPSKADSGCYYSISLRDNVTFLWMWELGYKESWAPRNRYFWTVVLEKMLESPLDCKEIQPVHPKGNQSWIFIGRTDAKAETTLATWFEELSHWKRPSCWERLKAGGEGDDRGWDGWIASLTLRIEFE